MDKPPRYNPVRITNILSEHRDLKLFPCQGLLIKLQAPYLSWQDLSADVSYRIIFNSWAFEVHEEKQTDYNIEIKYEQKYDLSNWLKFGNIFLGEVYISLAERNIKCVCSLVLVNENIDKLIVVNPQANHVSLLPEQDLEIVCCHFHSDDYRCNWQAEVNYDNRNQDLSNVELVEWAGVTKHNKHLCFGEFKANPHFYERRDAITKEIDEMRLSEQTHFYYNFKQKNFDLPNKIYPLAFLRFTSLKDDHYCSLCFELFLRVHKKKSMHAIPDPIKRRVENLRAYLINPLPCDIVDFIAGKFTEITIDIVQPSVLYGKKNDIEDKWTFSLEEARIKSLECFDRGTVIRWGVIFQRFCLKLSSVLPAISGCFIGALKLEYDTDIRRIVFWYHHAVIEKLNLLQGSASGPIHQSIGKRRKTSALAMVPCDKLKLSVIELEENKDKFCSSGKIVFWEVKKKDYQITAPVPLRKSSPPTITPIKSWKDTPNNQIPVIVDISASREVIINNNQDLIIRLRKPEMRSGTTDNYQWTFILEPFNSRLSSRSCRSYEKDSILYQELVLTTKNIPACFGYHEAGTVFIKNNEQTLEIKITVECIALHAVRVVDNFTANQVREITDDTKVIKDWQEGEYICIDPEKNYFLREPDVVGFKKYQWQLTILPYALPAELLENQELKKAGIDFANPWFPTCFTLPSIGTCRAFRSLFNSQPLTEKILSLVAQVVKDDYFLVGKFIYENNNHFDEEYVYTQFGELRSRYSILKCFYLVVDLRKYRSEKKLINVYSLGHESVITSVGEGDKLNIHMRSLTEQESAFGIQTTYNWRLVDYSVSCVSFLGALKTVLKDGSTMVCFSFRRINKTSGYVLFVNQEELCRIELR